MNGNDFVKLALQSPLHVMMTNTMLITVTGRKTGRKITLPVDFYHDGDVLWVLSRRDRTWWRNLAQPAPVEVHLHGHDFSGSAEVVSDEKAVADHMPEYFRHLPAAARYLGLQSNGSVLDSEGIARVAKERLFIRICLEP